MAPMAPMCKLAILKPKPPPSPVVDASYLDLQAALGLLAYHDIEPHPETGNMIQAGIGRYGPYLKYQGRYTSLPSEDEVDGWH